MRKLQPTVRPSSLAVLLALSCSTAAFSQMAFDTDPPFCGAIATWNILGPYDNPAGGAPSEQTIKQDYMTDGEVGELDFVWHPGATIMSIEETRNGDLPKNPNGIPTVFKYESATGQVRFEGVFGGTPSTLNNVMAYAQVYVVAEEERIVFLAESSDDSIQIIINRKTVWVDSLGGAGRDPCGEFPVFPENAPPLPIMLRPGFNSVIVKVFEGAGQWNFALRLQDEFGHPITEGLSTSLEPPPRPTANPFRRGDADGSGALKITDGIFLFRFLFNGSAAPPCEDAADADDNGVLNMTDGIYVLRFLFAGGAPPAAPFGACGEDPTVDELSCDRFPCA